ncbi:MAG TPA: cation diffusion facilitator family transporter [Candidatus Sulfotelmatobacter sp.]|nr:cation diffusion facilitator family transporter [Candidatus Sulfotelmatobacter sp.]
MKNQRILVSALLITILIFVVELVGGLYSGSLALSADAGHMLTDAMALTLALLAAIFAALPADKKNTFGFYRLEILSALFNGSLLTLIALFIFYEAYRRFAHPAAIDSNLMLMVATIGFLANVGAAVILAGASRDNLNVRGAFLHVISDAVSSVGVIVGGVLIHYAKWYYADPVISVFIGVLILRGALRLAFDAINVLLEAAPPGVSVAEVAAAIKAVKGVEDLHDLHIWSISSGLNAISAHLVITDDMAEKASRVLGEVDALLKEKYNIAHATFQTECESCPEGLICRIEPTRKEHGHQH